MKEVKSYDREVNEILDRILKLNEAHPEHYVDTRGMSEVVRNRKQNLVVINLSLISTPSERSLIG